MLRPYCTQRVPSCGERLAFLTGSAAARVLREGRSALGDLHVAARRSGLELCHATVYSGGEKRDRGEDETRFHGSLTIFVADLPPPPFSLAFIRLA
jgi:hypothetical protein